MKQNILFDLSKNKTMSDNYKKSYEKALKNSGFNKVLEYSNQNDGRGDRKRKKTSVILQPSFQSNIKDQNREKKIKSVDKHFPKNKYI